MLWLWMFIKLLDGECYPAPDGAREGLRGSRWQLQELGEPMRRAAQARLRCEAGKIWRVLKARHRQVSAAISLQLSPAIVLMRCERKSVSPGLEICGNRADFREFRVKRRCTTHLRSGTGRECNRGGERDQSHGWTIVRRQKECQTDPPGVPTESSVG